MSRHKVVLYNPRAVFYTMPLGLLAVGSALDRHRYDVVVVDGRLEADPLARLLAETEGALALGIGVLTGAPIRDALHVSRAVKAARPDLAVVWGGWHPSLFPAGCLEEPSVDAAVIGQGEETFVELLDRWASAAPLAGCPGAAAREDGRVRVTPPRGLRERDALPAHDYGLLPVARYFALKGRRQLDYVSSQGCRFRCAFCADPAVYGRAWTGLSPERVGDEVERLLRAYAFEELAFQDETFFTRPERVDALCDQLLGRGLRLAWTATLRADQACRMSEELFAKARRSGLRRVMIGVESGHQGTLDAILKDLDVEQVREAAARCARHAIGAHFNFILGFPDEPEESLEASFALAKRLLAMSPTFEASLFAFRPYPGTALAAAAAAGGYVFPRGLAEWAEFDYVGGRGPWVSPALERRLERFQFYARHAFGAGGARRWPLRLASRLRCAFDFYAWPLEKGLVEALRGPLKVS